MCNRIKQAMDSKGLNQTELAKKLGVTPQTVQQWIAGKTEPRNKKLQLLANALGVYQSWLLGDDKPTMPFVINNERSSYNAKPEPARPSIIPESDWKTLPPKARALIEEFYLNTINGKLTDDHIKLLQNMVDQLIKQ